MSCRKIIVLTPVRNEEWILPFFLHVTSKIADHIIIADQGSTDNSKSICKQFSKVQVIDNLNKNYDESFRQKLLLETSRELFPGTNIIITLDADEIFTSDSVQSKEWDIIQNALPGTVLNFEKPDIIENGKQAIRYTIPWPLGFIDDGSTHKGDLIHSIRIPVTANAPKVECKQIKVMHLAYLRPQAVKSRWRMYTVVEKLNKTRGWYGRRNFYKSENSKKIKSSQISTAWVDIWNKDGFNFSNYKNETFYWSDVEVLKLFYKHGCKMFWSEAIWDFDWNKCLAWATQNEITGLPQMIKAPSKFRKKIYDIFFYMLQTGAKFLKHG
jgi:glycosyltransferase involved in cell wall biosynthesis